MKEILSAEKRKLLFEKRKYYREHPEEAIKECAKRDDGIVIIGKKEKLIKN